MVALVFSLTGLVASTLPRALRWPPPLFSGQRCDACDSPRVERALIVT